MKIAILTPFFSVNIGSGRVAKQQLDEFSDRGNDITIFTFEDDLNYENVRIGILGAPENPLMRRIYLLLFPLDIIKTLKCMPKLKSFDLMISHQYPMTWLAYLAKKFYGVRFLYYNDGIPYPKLYPSFVERIYVRLLNSINNWIVKRADSAISISEFLRNELKRETGLDSEVVYCKIDTKFHKGLNDSKMSEKYGLDDGPLILYVGGLYPHKNVHSLIESFGIVKQEIPNAKLMVIGKYSSSDKYFVKLKQMCEEGIIFTGYVPDDELPYYYAACDVYATCSLWEGFNLPLAEAQACGKTVVAFDIGAHKEVINEEGILVEEGNLKAFGRAIVKLLKKLREDK